MRRRGQQGSVGASERPPERVSRRLESAPVGAPSPYSNRSRAPVTREEYGRAWEAYSNEPTMAAVQRALGCGQDVAQRLVFEGLPVLGLPGLEKRLQEEARLAMAQDKKLAKATEKLTAEGAARVLEARKAAVEKATHQAEVVLGDAGEQRVREAQLVRANREGAIALAQVTSTLLRSANRLAMHLDEALTVAEEKGLKGKEALEELGLGPKGALDLVKSMATVANRTAQASEAAVRMERLLAGDPTAIIQVNQGGSSSKPKTLEEAQAQFSQAKRAFERHAMRAQAVDAQVED